VQIKQTMATQKNNDVGKAGEELAIAFLRSLKMEILHANWRNKHNEVDIIAKENDTTIFVEVKARTTDNHGNPEKFVSKGKQNLLKKSALAFMELFETDKTRFDVIAITYWPSQEPDLQHFPDAFW
jgi:putative endonuclease